MKEIKIYQIHDNVTGNNYIGSTSQQYISDRVSRHRSYMKNNEYCSSSIVLKNNDYSYKCLEVCDESVRKQRERFYINNIENCINHKKLNFDKKTWEKEKIKCNCGAIVCRAGYAKHRKTDKHKNSFIDNKLVFDYIKYNMNEAKNNWQ